MATIDPRAADLGRRVQNLVRQQYGGDQRAAFNHYARNGEVPRAQVQQLLEDAGVGSMFTRGAYTDAVMDRFDTNRNNGVSWQEFQGGMRSVGQ